MLAVSGGGRPAGRFSISTRWQYLTRLCAYSSSWRTRPSAIVILPFHVRPTWRQIRVSNINQSLAAGRSERRDCTQKCRKESRGRKRTVHLHCGFGVHPFEYFRSCFFAQSFRSSMRLTIVFIELRRKVVISAATTMDVWLRHAGFRRLSPTPTKPRVRRSCQ